MRWNHQSEWRAWFAWYPVQTYDFDSVGRETVKIWIWLEVIERRRYAFLYYNYRLRRAEKEAWQVAREARIKYLIENGKPCR